LGPPKGPASQPRPGGGGVKIRVAGGKKRGNKGGWARKRDLPPPNPSSFRKGLRGPPKEGPNVGGPALARISGGIPNPKPTGVTNFPPKGRETRQGGFPGDPSRTKTGQPQKAPPPLFDGARCRGGELKKEKTPLGTRPGGGEHHGGRNFSILWVLERPTNYPHRKTTQTRCRLVRTPETPGRPLFFKTDTFCSEGRGEKRHE